VTPEEITRLRQVAEKAASPRADWTPTRWTEDITEWLVHEHPDHADEDGLPLLRVETFGHGEEAVARHVAAFQPKVALALLDEIERLRARLTEEVVDRRTKFDQVRRPVVPFEDMLASIQFAPLDDEDKALLRASGRPDLVEMASDDPVVARAATIRRAKKMLGDLS